MIHVALLDDRAAAPAFAVNDLFIGEDRIVDGVPIDLGRLAVNQTLFPEFQEDGLLLFIIGNIAGGEFAGPIQRKPQTLKRGAHFVDILIGPIFRMTACGNRGIFRWHTETIPAHRMENLKTLRLFIARDDIAHRVIPDMAHMDAARWIGEHFQRVEFWLIRSVVRTENIGLGPFFLPARLDVGGVIFFSHGASHKS